MASGDAQRVWFPELIAIVRQAGNPAMSMDALLRLRDRLDASLQTLRQTRQILPAMMWCPHCQARHRAAPPSVSVRATLLAVGRFTQATAAEVQALEKQWNRYRRQHQLTGDGQPENAVPSPRPRTRVTRRAPQEQARTPAPVSPLLRLSLSRLWYAVPPTKGGTTDGQSMVHRCAGAPLRVPGFDQLDARGVSTVSPALRGGVPRASHRVAPRWEATDYPPVHGVQELSTPDPGRSPVLHSSVLPIHAAFRRRMSLLWQPCGFLR